MNIAQIKATYASKLEELCTVRRYTGLSASRPYFDAEGIRGHVKGVGSESDDSGVIQQKYHVILYADDLIAKGITLPLTTDDVVIVHGKPELSIKDLNDASRRCAGVLIAYEFEAVG